MLCPTVELHVHNGLCDLCAANPTFYSYLLRKRYPQSIRAPFSEAPIPRIRGVASSSASSSELDPLLSGHVCPNIWCSIVRSTHQSMSRELLRRVDRLVQSSGSNRFIIQVISIPQFRPHSNYYLFFFPPAPLTSASLFFFGAPFPLLLAIATFSTLSSSSSSMSS